ncbi:lipase family protein [Nocardia stercoris]|uniref:Triacylglycerol lipase n=1 Tax=Nocardia stercoris TaxID=2483361 RepID=A0A3M2KZ40_9NOCA|nr:lipase family protein [Nocardia stercoris]RMI30551.1 triacylglycerol lipase [Nocardia stercoris]
MSIELHPTARSGRTRRIAGIAAACLALSIANSVTAQADPAFPPSFPPDQNQLPQLPSEPGGYHALPIATPDQDPWYQAPDDLADYAPGQILRTRQVQTRFVGLPVPVYTEQLLFRSENVHGDPIATATTVIVPGIPWTGSPRPVVSFQEAIDSTDSSCNPSHTLQVGTFKEATLAVSWLAQGFAINIPDFDGEFDTFATEDEGKMVLDSLRAMKSEPQLGLHDSGIALYGYSGGGLGTMHAAGLRADYAPDIQLLGSAFGGSPADLIAQAHYAIAPQPGLAGTGNFTMWLGFAGLAREYPDIFDPKKLLTPEGQAIVADVAHRCVYTAALTGMWRPIQDYFQPGMSFDDAPGVADVLRENSIAERIPDTPVLWFHGMWDELIPPRESVVPTVHKWRDAGADLRFVTIPLPEHITNAVVGWLPAQAWISAVLRGLPPGPQFDLDYPAPLPPGFPGA